MMAMKHSTQNHWAYGLCATCRILTNKNTLFRKLDQIPSSGEGRVCVRLPVSMGICIPTLTWRRKQVQLPIYCSYLDFLTTDNAHKLSDSEKQNI
jgi:hypothetical protein